MNHPYDYTPVVDYGCMNNLVQFSPHTSQGSILIVLLI